MARFSHLTFFHIGSTKVGRKSTHFMPVEGPDYKKEFYLETKNPPPSENTTVDNLLRWLFYGKKVEVKRRPRTFAPARFSLTTTLKTPTRKVRCLRNFIDWIWKKSYFPAVSSNKVCVGMKAC